MSNEIIIIIIILINTFSLKLTLKCYFTLLKIETLFCNYFECFIIFIVPDPVFNLKILINIFKYKYIFLLLKNVFILSFTQILYILFMSALFVFFNTSLSKISVLVYQDKPNKKHMKDL